MKTLFKALLLTIAFLGFVTTASAQTRYKVVDLGTLKGDFESTPWGINSHGEVVGSSTGPDGQRAFVYTASTGMMELPSGSMSPSISLQSAARDINDLGQVVGHTGFKAVRWDLLANPAGKGIGPHYLSPAFTPRDWSSEAVAINNNGEVAGSYSFRSQDVYLGGFYYSDETGWLDITGEGSGEANDINDSGQIAATRNGQAQFWEKGKSRDLGIPSGFSSSAAFGINEFAHVVGNATNRGRSSQHIVRFNVSFGPEDLGGLGDTNVLRRINALGESVGQGRMADGMLQGIIHTDTGGFQALNDLIADPGQWYIQDATDINESGEIVASAWHLVLKARRAVRLVPVREQVCEGKCQLSTNSQNTVNGGFGLEPGSDCTTNCIRSSEIVLTGQFGHDAAKVKAVVSVVDENGLPVANARVTVQWKQPDMKSSDVAFTDRNGLVVFNVTGKPGLYTIRIADVAAKGYSFDSRNSVREKSIGGGGVQALLK